MNSSFAKTIGSPFLLDAEGNDLVLELAGFLGGGGLLLRAERQRILFLAAHAVLLGDVLRGDAHVVLVVDVEQAIGDHRVDQLPVAHSHPVARAGQHVGRQAHAFLAAGDDDLGVAIPDRLRREHHGFQSGAAYRVDGECRHTLRQAALDDGLTRRVLAGAGRQHLAEDQLVDLLAVQLRTLQQRSNDGRAEIGRRRPGEGAAEFSDRGARCGNDDDFFHVDLQWG